MMAVLNRTRPEYSPSFLAKCYLRNFGKFLNPESLAWAWVWIKNRIDVGKLVSEYKFCERAGIGVFPKFQVK